MGQWHWLAARGLRYALTLPNEGVDHLQDNGQSARAVQILLGHTKIESTVRYLGVDVEDALALAEGTEV
jgi:site-specific recombinase XerD